MHTSMKTIPTVVIVVMVLVGLNELAYLGETSLALVLIAMAASIAALAYEIGKEKK